MSYTVDSVVARYVELREQKAALAARQAEEMKPFADSMGVIENWVLEQLNTQGVESFRTEHGTAYKTTATSMTMADKPAFIGYILTPLAENVALLLERIPGSTKMELRHILDSLNQFIRWDLTDLRAGKKGIQESLEQGGTLPPGVNMTQISTVNIRKS